MKAISFNPRFVGGLLKDTANSWLEDNALRLSAALAYYSIFSIAPLLVICLGVVGWVGSMFGPGETDKAIYEQLSGVMGPQSIEVVRSMVQSASKPGGSIWATIIGFVVLLVAAGSIFGQLKDALNTIWEVKPKPGLGVWGFIRERLLSFGMVLVIGFLLLTSFMLTAFMNIFNQWVNGALNLPDWFWGIIAFLISFVVVTLLFALIFKVLPDVKIAWKHVIVGAVVTALLFEIGKWLLGWYLGRESTASSYGAAGSVVLLLLWIYYASCILLFGAEFTQVYTVATGGAIEPSEIAEPVTPEARAQQGIAPGKSSSATAQIAPPPRESLPQIFPPRIEATPRAAQPFPRTLQQVPDYLRDNPGPSLGAALGCGLAIGLISRALEPTPPEEKPLAQIGAGSKALGAAGFLFFTRWGQKILARVGKALTADASRRALRQVRHLFGG